jgi:hypothetical protein
VVSHCTNPKAAEIASPTWSASDTLACCSTYHDTYKQTHNQTALQTLSSTGTRPMKPLAPCFSTSLPYALLVPCANKTGCRSPPLTSQPAPTSQPALTSHFALTPHPERWYLPAVAASAAATLSDWKGSSSPALVASWLAGCQQACTALRLVSPLSSLCCSHLLLSSPSPAAKAARQGHHDRYTMEDTSIKRMPCAACVAWPMQPGSTQSVLSCCSTACLHHMPNSRLEGCSVRLHSLQQAPAGM